MVEFNARGGRRRWRLASLSAALLIIGAAACEPESVAGAGAESSAAADVEQAVDADAAAEAEEAPVGMVEACRAARNMIDANVTAGLTTEFGEDERLREIADWAAADFYALANQVDDDDFAEWAVRMRLSGAELMQSNRALLSDPDWEDPSPGVLDRAREAADQVAERCQAHADVNIRRDWSLIDEYDVTKRRILGP